jgi:hypothetical protein
MTSIQFRNEPFDFNKLIDAVDSSTSLVFEHAAFSDASLGVDLICQKLPRLTALTTFKLFGVDLGDEVDSLVSKVFRALRVANKLNVLNVCELHFGDAAVADLVDLLTATPSITQLWASGARISAPGVQALGALLAKRACTLDTLSLGKNPHFDDDCGRILTRALARNISITRLYLTGTDFRTEGRYNMLSQLMESNTTLLSIDPHVRHLRTEESMRAILFAPLLNRNLSLPQRVATKERLIVVAFAMAELNLSLLELILIFEQCADGYDVVIAYWEKWAICKIIKDAFMRTKIEQQQTQ